MVLTTFGCSNRPTESTTQIASVIITSPIDTIVAVGTTVQLTASAQDAAGAEITGINFTWSSSPAFIASVDADGLVTALQEGAITILATTDETAGVSGSLMLRVVPANLILINEILADPFGNSLVNNLTFNTRSVVEDALAECANAIDTGNIVVLIACLTVVRTEVHSATDATDRVLLGVYEFYVTQIEQSLNL
jgi:hypothetical protein